MARRSSTSSSGGYSSSAPSNSSAPDFIHPVPPSQMVKQAVAACEPLLQRAGLNPRRVLGCGEYGCVVPAGNDHVAKLSFDSREAELAAIFARSWRSHPAIPRVERVSRMPPSCGQYRGRPVYVIVREDLEDVEGYIEPAAVNDLQRALFAFERFNPAGPTTNTRVANAFSRLAPYPKAMAIYKQALQFSYWALQHDLVLQDVHLMNWGLRDGHQLVLRDFGLSLSKEKGPSAEELPQLSGLRQRHQLRIEHLGRLGLSLRGLRR